MAMFELEEFVSGHPTATGAENAFDRVVAAVRQWRLRRQTTAKLSRDGL